MQDRDSLKILLRARILDDPHLGGQRAEGIFHIIEHHDRAASCRNVLAEFLIACVVRLIAGEVHVVGSDPQFAHVVCQCQSSMSLGLCGEEHPDCQQHET